MKNPVIYVVLNGELKMTAGKAVAQAVHAAMMQSANAHGDFLSDYERTVVVLEANNTQQLLNLYTYLDETEVEANYYIDEGRNEVDAYSVTALVAGPIAHEDKELRDIFAPFPLFGKKKNDWGRMFHS